MAERVKEKNAMLMASVIGLAVLASILMAVDWYIWEPRYRAESSIGPAPVDRNGNQRIDLRTAA